MTQVFIRSDEKKTEKERRRRETKQKERKKQQRDLLELNTTHLMNKQLHNGDSTGNIVCANDIYLNFFFHYFQSESSYTGADYYISLQY